MTTDFRALCAELTATLAERINDKGDAGSYYVRAAHLLIRARAALAKADEPAVPQGREPAAVTGQPSDEELLATLDKATAAFPPRHPEAEGLNASEYLLALELRKARAVLARWGNPTPQPPEPGEVGVVVAWLRATGEGQPCLSDEGYARLTRAADLLERLSPPQPVPVSERLPGPEDCDSHGWCWVLYSAHSTWTLEPPYGQDGMPTGWTHWLPAHALPLPEVGE